MKKLNRCLAISFLFITVCIFNITIGEQWDNEGKTIKKIREILPSASPSDPNIRKSWEKQLIEKAVDKNESLSIRKIACRTLGTLRIKNATSELDRITTMDVDRAYPWALTAKIWIKEGKNDTDKIKQLLKELEQFAEISTDTKETKILKGIKRRLLEEEISYYASLCESVPKDLPEEIISSIYIQEKMVLATNGKFKSRDELILFLLKQMEDSINPRQVIVISSAIEQSAKENDFEIIGIWLDKKINELPQHSTPVKDKVFDLRISKVSSLLDSLSYLGDQKALPYLERFAKSDNKYISLKSKQLLSCEEKHPSRREQSLLVGLEDSWPIIGEQNKNQEEEQRNQPEDNSDKKDK